MEMKNAQSDTLLNDVAQGAATTTLTSGNFGTPTGEIYLVFDYDVSAKYEVKRCTVAGSSITGMSHVSGANVAHSAGAKVGRMIVAEVIDDLAAGTTIVDDAIVNRHIAADAVETAQIKNGNVTNAKLSTADGELGAVWKDWTPTFTNFTLGNGTLVAKYKQIGKTVHWNLTVVLGSTSSMGSSPYFTLPVTPASNYIQYQTIGIGLTHDVTFGLYEGNAKYRSTNTVFLYTGTTAYSSTAPMTWASGDKFMMSGTFEAS